MCIGSKNSHQPLRTKRQRSICTHVCEKTCKREEGEDKKDREKKNTKRGVRWQEIGHRLCDAWGERALNDDGTPSSPTKKIIPPLKTAMRDDANAKGKKKKGKKLIRKITTASPVRYG